jgi:hypothetical protein
MLKQWLVFILIALLLISCAKTGVVVIQPVYKSNRLRDIKLLVSVPRSEVVAENPDEIHKQIGEGDPDSVLFAFMKKTLPKYLIKYSFASSVQMAEFKHDTNFAVTDFIIDDTVSFSLDVPKSGYCLHLNELNNTLLFFHNSSNDKYPFSTNSIQFVIFIERWRTFSYTSEPSIEHNGCECLFAIWDNRIGRSVSHGLAFVDLVGTFDTQNDWEGVISQIAGQILLQTPFTKWPGSTKLE